MAIRHRLFSALVHAGGSILLIAACASSERAAANRDTTPSPACRCILGLKRELGDESAALRELASEQRVQLESVTELGDHLYRLLFRSHADDDCSTLINRFRSDPRVSYATADERKRTGT